MGDTLGVEASKEAKTEKRSRIKDDFAVAFIKGKLVLTGVLFKQITMLVIAYDTATWIKPYCGTMLATAM